MTTTTTTATFARETPHLAHELVQGPKASHDPRPPPYIEALVQIRVREGHFLLLRPPPPHASASASAPCPLELDDIPPGNDVPLPLQTYQQQGGGVAISLSLSISVPVPVPARRLDLDPVQRRLPGNLPVLVGDLEVRSEVSERMSRPRQKPLSTIWDD